MATGLTDLEFVKELQDDLMCSICMKVLNEPQMVNCCEQKFCKNCLTKWMTNKKTCPLCRSSDFNHILLKGLSRRISELKVYCANKAHGCKSTLKVSEYQRHLSVDNARGCFFTKLPCPIQCGADIFRGDLDNHCKEKCPKRRVQCQYCKSKGEYQMITGGHTDTCPCYPLVCPRACGAEVIRKDLTAHQGVCQLEPVACPFSDIGCKVKVPRRDLGKHIQSSMLQHMRDMALSHTATKTQLTALKQEHEALKKDYTGLKEDNEARMKATGAVLQLYRGDQYISSITSQLYTLLVDTSTVEMGSTLLLALSESNTESGHHYITLEGCKFKLKWVKSMLVLKLQSNLPVYLFYLYLVNGNLHTLQCCEFTIEFTIDISHELLAGVCCGKPQTRPNYGEEDLLGSTSSIIPFIRMIIGFNHHQKNDSCNCNCHEEEEGVAKEDEENYGEEKEEEEEEGWDRE